MKLGFRLLEDVCSVNNFVEVQRLELVAGNPGTLYFRLIMRSTDPDLRYVPASGATVSVTFDHIDSNQVITRVATNPFVGDNSIWSVPLLATDRITFASMQVSLTEGAVTRKLIPFSELAFANTDSKRYFC